tara:strand:+ start:100 stop:582 length:483 start_codon:yes stop_codon:yes gene_type:complete
MNDYRVGQILFLIADATKVVPIQVVEEVIRTTLEGKQKTYIIKFPDKKRTTADISKIKGSIFTSKDELKKYMIENAKNAIYQMIETADEMCLNVFDVNINDENDDELSNKTILNLKNLSETTDDSKVQPSADSGIIKVDLGNGKFGKISTSDLDNAGAPK